MTTASPQGSAELLNGRADPGPPAPPSVISHGHGQYLGSPGNWPLHYAQPLLASRPISVRGASERRVLFLLHHCRPLLIAAWHRGDSLDAAGAARLWAAHSWELNDQPSNVAELLDAGLPLQSLAESAKR